MRFSTVSSGAKSLLVACHVLFLSVVVVMVNGQGSSTTIPKPMQTFFIPLPEEALLMNGFQIINGAAVSPVVSLISFAISTDNTVIWYNHWEGGYDKDPTKPTTPTTEIWGDGIASNGCAPTVKPCTDIADKLYAGTSIVIQNEVATPRNAITYDGTVKYDGGDMVLASYPITMTRGAYPKSTGSLMAGAVEILDTDSWGTDFIVPVGSGLPRPFNASATWDAMEYTAVYVMAQEDNTMVVLPGSTQYLSKGQSCNAQVKMGARITSTKPIQVDLITGDMNSNYEMRWFSLIATSAWSNRYLSPVGDSYGSTRVILYNNNPTDIVVDVTTYNNVTKTTSSQPVTVPARNYNLSPVIPKGTGALLASRNTSTAANNFLALSFTDTDEGGWTTGKVFDWGFPCVPTELLTPQVLVGWGYGCTDDYCPPGEAVRSVVWVAAMEDADIYIDYNNVGTNYDIKSVKQFEGIKVTDLKDPKKDMSGAVIFATKPGSGFNGTSVNIAAAWGQDPEVSLPNQPISMDLGTVVLPFSGIRVSKVTDKPTVDVMGRLRYTIRIANVGQVTVKAGDITIVDPGLPDQKYVPGSTTYSIDGGKTITSIPDDTIGVTPFPLDEKGLNTTADLVRRGGIHEISFDVYIDQNTLRRLEVDNTGYIQRKNGNKLNFATSTPVTVAPSILIANTVYKGQNGGASCNDTSIAKELVTDVAQTLVTYCYNVTNTGNTWLKSPVIQNLALNAIHSTPDTFYLPPGGSHYVYFDTNQDTGRTPVKITGSLSNVATVTATPIWMNGNIIDPRMLPVRNSDPSEVRIVEYNPAVKISNTVFMGDGDCASKGMGRVAGVYSTPITYCFLVTNIGNTYLRQIMVTDADTKPTFANTRTELLPPGQSYLLTLKSVIDGNYSNFAKVIATPSLSDGTILTQYPKVEASDPSGIVAFAPPNITTRAGTRDPLPTGTDPPTLCMTPHWKDSGNTQDLICPANDITIVSMKTKRGTCKEGDNITLTAEAKLRFKSTLYDPTWFVALDGGNAKIGTCILKGFTYGYNYTVTGGGSDDDDHGHNNDDDDDEKCGTVAWNSDALGGNDKCGDVIMDGGSGIVKTPFFNNVTMTCTDTNDDGTMDVAVCFSWRTAETDGYCTLTNSDIKTRGLLADAYPSSNMKCSCVRVEIPTVTVHQPVCTGPNCAKVCK